jgi:two-component system chemotaxis response regulator CheB
MEKIRILIVDDAAVVRRLVASALEADPDLEVAGTAANGRIALERLDDLRPDVVLLDLEMPEMDGIATLTALRKTHPRLPVIMFSRFTQRGVEATVHALTLGADDYVPKPGDGIGVEQCLHSQLIPKIKQFARRGKEDVSVSSVSATLPDSARPGPSRDAGPVELVAVGASTGGPNALGVLLSGLPRDWSVPVAIVQHMGAEFTGQLAVRLAEKSGLSVREGVAGEAVTGSRVWVAPGNQHLTFRKAPGGPRLMLDQSPAVNSCRPSVDVLFASAAAVFGAGVLAVVLTGMGQDGLRGCEQVRQAGGQVVVQDQASSVVWSMPGAVARAGLADRILPLEELAPEIVRRVRKGRGDTSCR